MKKFLLTVAALSTAAILGGCGSTPGDASSETQTADSTVASTEVAGSTEATTAPEENLMDMDVASMVTLCEYKNIAVSVKAPVVDEEELKQLISGVYIESMDSGITDRAVAVGDTVIIDYEGKKDGVAFAGGTAKNADLAIGSGQFIEGFEEGLVGVMPGETVDLDLTFPEQYHSDELAGQAVVFTVTVHYILPEFVAEEEMYDEVVQRIGINGVNTVSEYVEFVRNYLEQSAQSDYEEEIKDQILEYLIDNSTFNTLPENLVQQYKDTVYSNIATGALQYSVDVDTYCMYFYGMSGDETVSTYADMTLKQDIIMQAIANEQNLVPNDEEMNEILLEYAQAAGLSTVEEYLGTATLDDFRGYFLNEKVYDYLMEQANITED